jgi:hypothetical protein
MATHNIIIAGRTYMNAPGVKTTDGTSQHLSVFTDDATAAADQILEGYTAYVDGEKITGSIADGDEIEYGLTDGTLPLIGVAKIGSAVI